MKNTCAILLSTLFLLIAVLADLRACAPARPNRRPRLVLSLAAFAAALLSKAPALILPAVLVVLDVYPLRRLGGRPGRWFGREARRVWREKLPFFALSVLSLRRAQQTDSARRIRQKSPWLTTSPPAIVPKAVQIWTAMVCLTKRTEPSPSRTLTPPGCRLVAVTKSGLSKSSVPPSRQLRDCGGRM
jgi:hypothetical protein